MLCPKCQRDFPADLLHVHETGDGLFVERRLLCPLCALALHNAAGGLPPDTPFAGPKAAALHALAVEHLKATAKEEAT